MLKKSMMMLVILTMMAASAADQLSRHNHDAGLYGTVTTDCYLLNTAPQRQL